MESLREVDALTETETEVLDRARMEAAKAPPLLNRTVENNKEWIAARAELVGQTNRKLMEAFNERDTGTDAFADWDDAARDHRRALELLYSTDFDELVDRLRDGDPSAIDFALDFLEVDPWCFRSGYAKETLLRLLCRHSFTADQGDRIERIVLNSVDIGDRREFRLSCRLARHLGRASLRDALHERVRPELRGTMRRSVQMLVAMRRPRFSEGERTSIRTMLIDAVSGEDDAWPARRWAEPLARDLWSSDWAAELVELALADPIQNAGSLRLLADVGHVALAPDQMERFAELLLQVVDHGGDESWFEGLARLVGTPEIERTLEERDLHPDDDVRRRAWWARRAIRNARGES